MYVLLPEYIKYIIYHNIVDAENMNSVCVQCTLCICSTNMTPSQTSHTGKVTLEKKNVETRINKNRWKYLPYGSNC